jgi:hypothetical protein
MFGMWPFVVGDIFQGLLMKMDFKSWKISLFLALTSTIMGKFYETCQVLNILPYPSLHPFLVTSSQNIIT